MHIHIMYFKKNSIAAVAGITVSMSGQLISQDPGTGGVPIEVVRLYTTGYLHGSQPFYTLSIPTSLIPA